MQLLGHPNTMTLWYSARHIFNNNCVGWKTFIDFSGLYQAEEIVSLDCSLNEPVFQLDTSIQEEWQFGVTTENEFFAECYTSLEYVIKRASNIEEYNLLALCFQPNVSCNNIAIDNFIFIGYDLLDKSHGNSALTNCGGWPVVFANSELNKFGLIDNFDRSKVIQTELLVADPNEFHADTNIWAIWRHKTIGRK